MGSCIAKPQVAFPEVPFDDLFDCLPPDELERRADELVEQYLDLQSIELAAELPAPPKHDISRPKC
jgi:hypothetical protein